MRRSRRSWSGRIETPADAVLDASALIRAVTEPRDEAALAWVDAVVDARVSARVPELVYAEAGSALTKYARAGAMSADQGDERLDYILSLPFEIEPLHRIARAAFGLAIARGVSIYDACYLALSIGYNAVLVTADRALAAQAERSALLPDEGPPG